MAEVASDSIRQGEGSMSGDMRAVDLASGKWRQILPMLGLSSDVLDGKHHPCPRDDSGTDRFRFADRNGSGNYFCACSEGDKGGMALLMCCRDLSYAGAAKEVERVVGPAMKQDPQGSPPDPRKALNAIRRQIENVGAGVRLYLAARGLEVAPGLKQARLKYWDCGSVLGEFDCMVGLLQDAAGKPQSYHITYLASGEKASVPCPRKVMTPVETINGAAIRLYPPAATMGVAEGIETAIAAKVMGGMPVWAAANANGLRQFEPPKECTHLIVFADNDKSFTGQSAAYELARRMVKRDIRCDVWLPTEGDWNDELVRKAA